MTVEYLIMDTSIEPQKVQDFIRWTTVRISAGATGFYIALSTPGGVVTSGILMANYIQSLPVPVTMHNVASVGSIGIPIYAAATERLSNPLSGFVFHGAGRQSQERLDEARLKDMLDSIKSQNDLIARSISETSGMDYLECRNLLSGEVTKSAQWAVENDICQRIEEFRVPEGVQLTNLF